MPNEDYLESKDFEVDKAERNKLFKEAYRMQKALLINKPKLSEMTSEERKRLTIELAKKYEALAGQDIQYIVGFIHKGIIYNITLKPGEMQQFMTLDQASRGAGKSLRFNPTISMKEQLIAMGATEVKVPVDEMLKMVNDGIQDDIDKTRKKSKNKGHWFEKLVTNLNGLPWQRDNIPFYVQGDMVLNNMHYQIKFEGATFSNEQSLNRLMLQKQYNLIKLRK